MINFIITKTGVVVVDGAHLVNGLTNMAGAEAKYGLYQLDNLAPVAQTYTDAGTWTGVAQSLDAGNLNDTAKQVLGSIFGGLAGGFITAFTGSLTVGLVIDKLSGDVFESVYEKLSTLAANSEQWQNLLAQLFDKIGILNPVEWEKHINELVDTFFNTAAKFVQPRRDPLTLDLDGDGLKTVGTSAGILFDHDGDGIKNGTGWVKADDGLLVMDKNGNGSIDNGHELFGDAFVKSNGQLAADGFDALASLDGNGDGKVDASDAQFGNLKVWQDLNQDGLSQAGELFTLAQLGIASINVTSTDHSQTLPNGNQIADLGTYTKTDGSLGTTGEVIGDINLATDTFHRQFPDHLDTSAVAHLPDMQGSGAVRDLREAANDCRWRMAA